MAVQNHNSPKCDGEIVWETARNSTNFQKLHLFTTLVNKLRSNPNNGSLNAPPEN